MGFGQNQRKTFFKLKDGKVVVNIREENESENAHLLEVASSVNKFNNKDGVPVIDIRLDWFEGYLQSIKVLEDEKWGKSWIVTFADEAGELYVWTTFYDSSIFQSFINCLATIEKEFGLIKLRPWLGEDKKGVKQTKLTVYHNDEKMNWKFKPEDLPKITPVIDEDGNEVTDAKGNVLYNKKKRIMWLCEQIVSILKKLNGNGSDETIVAKAATEEHVAADASDDDKSPDF